MRAMDGVPELTGMYLQRLFVLPVISPAPELKLVLPDPCHPSVCGRVGFARLTGSHTDVCSPAILTVPPCHRPNDLEDCHDKGRTDLFWVDCLVLFIALC